VHAESIIKSLIMRSILLQMMALKQCLQAFACIYSRVKGE